MPKYKVEVPILVYVTAEIEADSEESAMDKSEKYDFNLREYANNSVGVYDDDLEIHIASEAFELSEFDIEVNKVEEI